MGPCFKVTVQIKTTEVGLSVERGQDKRGSLKLQFLELLGRSAAADYICDNWEWVVEGFVLITFVRFVLVRYSWLRVQEWFDV